MISRFGIGILLILSFCSFSGCNPPPGVPPSDEITYCGTIPRTPAERIKLMWIYFENADNAREEKQAIRGIRLVGAEANSEIPNLMKIADGEDYSDEVREAANQAIESIQKAVNESSDR